MTVFKSPDADLLDMLPQCLGVQVDFAALVTGFLEGLLRLVNPGLVFGQRVVSLEPAAAPLAEEWEGVV